MDWSAWAELKRACDQFLLFSETNVQKAADRQAVPTNSGRVIPAYNNDEHRQTAIAA